MHAAHIPAVLHPLHTAGDAVCPIPELIRTGHRCKRSGVRHLDALAQAGINSKQLENNKKYGCRSRSGVHTHAHGQEWSLENGVLMWVMWERVRVR